MTLAIELINDIHSESKSDTKKGDEKKSERKNKDHKDTSKEFFIGTNDERSTKDANDDSTEGNAPGRSHSENLSEEGFKKRPVVTHKITPRRKVDVSKYRR